MAHLKGRYFRSLTIEYSTCEVDAPDSNTPHGTSVIILLTTAWVNDSRSSSKSTRLVGCWRWQQHQTAAVTDQIHTTKHTKNTKNTKDVHAKKERTSAKTLELATPRSRTRSSTRIMHHVSKKHHGFTNKHDRGATQQQTAPWASSRQTATARCFFVLASTHLLDGAPDRVVPLVELAGLGRVRVARRKLLEGAATRHQRLRRESEQSTNK